VAFASVARLLGPDTTSLTDRGVVGTLRLALIAAEQDSALSRMDAFAAFELPSSEQLAGRWVRWFDLGRVAPYEGSNVVTTVAGVTPRLADIAGFYRAFNTVVRDDRPDHIVAQLEFVAVTVLMEAEAIERGDLDHAEIAADATRAFLRDHLGGWIDAWAARVDEIAELAPWAPIAATAVDLVRSEAAIRNVIPLRTPAALVADAGIPSDDEAITDCHDLADEDLLL